MQLTQASLLFLKLTTDRAFDTTVASAAHRNFMLLSESEDAPLKAIGRMGEREGGGRDGGRDGGSQLCFTGDVFTI